MRRKKHVRSAKTTQEYEDDDDDDDGEGKKWCILRVRIILVNSEKVFLFWPWLAIQNICYSNSIIIYSIKIRVCTVYAMHKRCCCCSSRSYTECNGNACSCSNTYDTKAKVNWWEQEERSNSNKKTRAVAVQRKRQREKQRAESKRSKKTGRTYNEYMQATG